jgi:hypothetical protein
MNSNHKTGESNVPFGDHQIQRVRHIKIPDEKLMNGKNTPAYFQNPDAPVFHPSRDETARAKMLDNLTKFLSKNKSEIESRGESSLS